MTLIQDLVWGLRRTLARRGVVGTARMCVDRVRRLAARRSEVGRQAAEEEARYDLEHGVETRAEAVLRGMTIDGEVEHGNRYGTILPREFRAIFASVGADLCRYTFVDLGSGKGRAMLLAAEYPFRAIVGVEFAKELHEVAETNIRNYKGASRRCPDVRSVHLDAGKYRFPEGPVFIYMYNPFDEHIMSRVAANIEKSIVDGGQEVMILYLNPVAGHVLDRLACLTPERFEKRAPRYTVYRSCHGTAGTMGASA